LKRYNHFQVTYIIEKNKLTTTQLKDPPISKRLAKNIKRNFV